MSENKLVAETRTQFGKGAARKIRRDHKIPAVMYGHGSQPIHITLPGHQAMLALKQSNALLTIVLDGVVQWRAPPAVEASTWVPFPGSMSMRGPPK